jgi:hypothetical protein
MLPLLATPWALVALAAVPALTALYVLRHSFRRVPVSSLMLWLDAAESRATGMKVRRLQTPILFFLELLALLLFVLAAADPRIEVGAGALPLVVVLDDSFSMQAGGADSARSRGLVALQRELPASSHATIRYVLAGSTSQTLGETHDLDDWRCRASTSRLAEALVLASELGGPTSRLLVVTDHAPTEEPKLGRLVWWAFGEPRPNVAVVNAGRTTRDDQDRVSFEIANYAEGPRDVTVVVDTVPAAKELHRERVALAARATARRALRLTPGAGPLRIRILESDALDFDNQAFLEAEEIAPIRVDLSISDETIRGLFDKALKATGKTLPPGKRPDLLVTDAAVIPTVDPETWIVQVLAEKEADAFLGPFVLERTHPLAEGLDLAGVVWGAGKSTELPGTPIVMAGNVPLLTDTESAAGQHKLRIRLRPDLSMLPRTPAWPILVWNLTAWRSRELPGLARVNLRLGETAVVSVPPGVDKVEVKSPDGSLQTTAVRGQRAAILAEEPGVYEIRHGGETSHFAVSARSAEESDLKDCVTGKWGEWIEDAAAPPGIASLRWLLCLAALAVLAVHLYLATRGSLS